MLFKSQPLNEEISAKLDKNITELEQMTEKNIVSLRMGRMFDDYYDQKIRISTRIRWLWLHIKGLIFDKKHIIRNLLVWRKTLKKIRPYEGFHGMLKVMMTHLNDYIRYEENHGHSHDDCRFEKITTAKETVEIIVRLSSPESYITRRTDDINARYPDYKMLISEYRTGGRGCSGSFVPQENGWVGEESGKDPRKGYFEFRDGKFEVVESPDITETNRLLEQLSNYNKEQCAAYNQAELDADEDFNRLHQLLKDNIFNWWDY